MSARLSSLILLALLLESPIEELNPLYDIKDRQLVLILHVRATLIRIYLLGHGTGLVLDEVECFRHKLGSRPSMNSDSQHADHTASQAIVQTEGRARPALHIEGDRLQAAHVEERLVLDRGKTRMVQEVAEHETAWLVLHAWHLLETCSIDVILAVNSAFFAIIRLFQELFVSVLLV